MNCPTAVVADPVAADPVAVVAAAAVAAAVAEIAAEVAEVAAEVAVVAVAITSAPLIRFPKAVELTVWPNKLVEPGPNTDWPVGGRFNDENMRTSRAWACCRVGGPSGRKGSIKTTGASRSSGLAGKKQSLYCTARNEFE